MSFQSLTEFYRALSEDRSVRLCAFNRERNREALLPRDFRVPHETEEDC